VSYYYCTKCKRFHNPKSKIGLRHLPFAKKKQISSEVELLSKIYGLSEHKKKKIKEILETFANPPYSSNPGVKALMLQLYQKLIESSKRGAPLAKKTAKRIAEAVKIGTKELIKTFRMLREHRLSHKQLKELATAIDVLWRSGLIDLDLSEDDRKRKREIMTLIKYGLLDPDLLKKIIERKIYRET